MEKELDAKRFEHTLGVAYTAAALAMCYDVDLIKAETAGLLHDCAKCLSDDKKISICKKNNMEINTIENRNPYLLHAKAGCCIAKNKFGIEDQDILNAILNHTTGRPGMSDLEKIIYIADYIEPGRKQAPDLPVVRKLAFQNLDQALLKVLSDTLNYLNHVGGEIDPMTKGTYNHYKNILENPELGGK
ncbi:MAG: bis(5'-nucleosyl)-tetraphosphatase (symmetrical) YqeK [Suilimivivens sp.]